MSAACIGSGLCTVSIFSCPTSATLAGWAFFRSDRRPNPNLRLTAPCEYNSEMALNVCPDKVCSASAVVCIPV
ncbi:hypothetical protein F5051DRAFT_233487 [Lentinula edodes]|nr:hypothetical protein F5051DRAFT_233487 [Lentinula edodes]